MIKRFIFLFGMVCLVLTLSCMKQENSVYRKSKSLMDTYVTISVVSASTRQAEDSIDRAFLEIERFGRLIDFFSGKSEISRINENAGIREVVVSPETLDVIKKAVYVAEKSGGAFDPTIGPVIRLWDFHEKIKPSEEAVGKALPLVNYRNIRIDERKSTVFLTRKGMMLDLGGIAKGYAADLAVSALKSAGIGAGIVAVAGDIRTFGVKPDGGPWNIGVRNPRQKGDKDELIATVHLSNMAISTAGDYERFFMAGGKRYHHLLDPSTGYPAYGCRSVSIVSGEGVLSDAFSTAVFILGPDSGLKLLRQMGMDGIIVESAGGVIATPGLKGKMEIEGNY